MIVKSSEHYDFHYLKGSVAEKDIEKIIKLQEKCYEEICSRLKIQPNFKIQYYLLDTPELVGEIYGDNEPCNGFASAPDTIYAVYNKEVKCIGHHEDAHIISYTINRPNSNFIREGLAMYFDKTWWGKENIQWVKLFLEENKYISIVNLLSNTIFFQHSDEITYPIAGAFTEFLINYYGMGKYLVMYKSKDKDFIKTIEKVYTGSIEEMESGFLSFINKN